MFPELKRILTLPLQVLSVKPVPETKSKACHADPAGVVGPTVARAVSIGLHRHTIDSASPVVLFDEAH